MASHMQAQRRPGNSSDVDAEVQSNKPLFLNFTAELAPFGASSKKHSKKRSNVYKVSGVNILNRNSVDSKTALERLQRRRENHNFVERRRRDNINHTITTLSDLIPYCSEEGAKLNKGSILHMAVEYIRDMQDLNQALSEENIRLGGTGSLGLPANRPHRRASSSLSGLDTAMHSEFEEEDDDEQEDDEGDDDDASMPLMMCSSASAPAAKAPQRAARKRSGSKDGGGSGGSSGGGVCKRPALSSAASSTTTLVASRMGSAAHLKLADGMTHFRSVPHVPPATALAPAAGGFHQALAVPGGSRLAAQSMPSSPSLRPLYPDVSAIRHHMQAGGAAAVAAAAAAQHHGQPHLQ
ncbi:hypothetical protein GGI02_003746 [Coemansia sp. RSA 2322]|nr:hypothetical protein GGI02_003746 [Coemansia sp. RSA 2322]